jgi:hypothetical protein
MEWKASQDKVVRADLSPGLHRVDHVVNRSISRRLRYVAEHVNNKLRDRADGAVPQSVAHGIVDYALADGSEKMKRGLLPADQIIPQGYPTA